MVAGKSFSNSNNTYYLKTNKPQVTDYYII
jgi:hypothetical protein